MFSLRIETYPLLGRVILATECRGLCLVSLQSREAAEAYLRRGAPGVTVREDPAALDEVDRQLREYLRGARAAIDLPLSPRGTPFQHSVWAALDAIPYGETRSYREIAAQISRPRAVRAVGAANGANPLCIVRPCHRVIGASGALTGYAYGLDLKRRLLDLENAAGVVRNTMGE